MWLLFGAVLVPAAVPHMTWQAVLYAVLSLTLVRMVPVALSVLGTKMDRATVLFVGWFGPRGLATIIFGLLALEDLAPAVTHRVLPVLICTVLLSVLAHGFTAGRSPDATGGHGRRMMPSGRNCRCTSSLSGGLQAARTRPGTGVPATEYQFGCPRAVP